jgi:peptidoglycan biosynthesis protein MviN/MurJ (putative lipid II flippase)
LQALGDSKTPVLALAIGIVVKIVLTLLLVSNSMLNIYGLAIASSFGYFISAFIAIYQIKKRTAFRLTFLQIALPIISCCIIAFGILFWLWIFGESLTFIKLFTCVLISIIVYFGCIFAFGQFKFKDVKNILQINKN